jgi:hypothetical protein
MQILQIESAYGDVVNCLERAGKNATDFGIYVCNAQRSEIELSVERHGPSA